MSSDYIVQTKPARDRPTVADSRQDDPFRPERPTSQSIDWYAPGQNRTVEINGVEVTVRFIGRKGRRARIAITAPAGVALFSDLAFNKSDVVSRRMA